MDAPSGFITSSEYAAFADSRELELIGGRGYSRLYKFEDGGQFKVLKCLARGYEGDPLYERLLLKEYEIGKGLSSPYVCQTLDWIEHPDLGHAIVMQWVDGKSLDEYADYDAKTLRRIAVQICQALEYIHKHQIIHRDLKPSNILVTRNGQNVKLIDFGFSDTDHHTVLKEAAGTLKYASPELKAGGAVDLRSDIYSLGVILSELAPKAGRFGKRWRRIAAWCMSEDKERRPSSAIAVQKKLTDNGHKMAAISAFVVLGVVLTVWLLGPVVAEKRQRKATHELFEQVTKEIIETSGID